MNNIKLINHLNKLINSFKYNIYFIQGKLYFEINNNFRYYNGTKSFQVFLLQ